MNPSDPSLRLLPQAYQVFISSTFLDLDEERKAVRDALLELNVPLASIGVGLIPMDLRGGANPKPPLDVCLQGVRNCQLMVSLVGERSGALIADGRSITECEFDEARSLKIPCLAYLRDGTTPILPEYVDKDPRNLDAIKRLKRKIDAELKRDVFRTPEQLRGHIIRDVLNWLLNDPEIKARLGHETVPVVLPELKNYFDLLKKDDISSAIEIITSRQFALRMRELGIAQTHEELLRDLLELGSLSKPSLVTDKYQRSRLLMEYLSQFRGSLFETAVLHEAKLLEGHFNSPQYSFRVSQAEAQYHSRCDHAMPNLKRMLKCAWATHDPHTIAEAMRSIAAHYSQMGEHQKAKTWYWQNIKKLCGMPEICAHCLGRSFIEVAAEELDCHRTETASNRLLKALLIGQVISDEAIQARALRALSYSLELEGQLDAAVACGVLAARCLNRIPPFEPQKDYASMLANLIAQHGQDKIASTVNRVEQQAEQIINQLLELHELSDFVDSLGLTPGNRDCH